MKVVINACFGGFSVSTACMEHMILNGSEIAKKEFELVNGKYGYGFYRQGDEFRKDPFLVKAVEELGALANGSCADLKIVEIPDDVSWEISEYDGSEHVAEKHRTWS